MGTLEERIRDLMEAMGWDVAKVAAIANVTPSAVHQWLGKSSKIIKTIGDLEAALLLERASGFSALWLAKGKGPKMVPRPNGLPHADDVTKVTPLPNPFRQDRFDALAPEQKIDVAQVAAYLTDAFARHAQPPTGGSGAWKQKRVTGERQSQKGPRSQRKPPKGDQSSK